MQRSDETPLQGLRIWGLDTFVRNDIRSAVRAGEKLVCFFIAEEALGFGIHSQRDSQSELVLCDIDGVGAEVLPHALERLSQTLIGFDVFSDRIRAFGR